MKVMEALYEKMAPEVDLVDKMLPFAGIATIGDVMDLQDENRILAWGGMEFYPVGTDVCGAFTD